MQQLSLSCGLKRRAPGKAGIDVMPPLEFVAFAHLPAEQHDAAIAQRRKIDQTTLKILELNAERLQLSDLKCQFRESGRVRDTIGYPAATSLRGFRGLLRFVAENNEPAMSALDSANDRSHAGK